MVVHAIERRRNANHVIISYRLSWRVNNEVWKRTFRTAAQAESFRSELLSATRRGEAFSRTTGRPYGTTQDVGMSWYALRSRTRRRNGLTSHLTIAAVLPKR